MDDNESPEPHYKTPVDQLSKNCLLWQAGYETESQEDDTESENSEEEIEEESQGNWDWYHEETE
jgi:hypothetical protein